MCLLSRKKGPTLSSGGCQTVSRQLSREDQIMTEILKYHCVVLSPERALGCGFRRADVLYLCNPETGEVEKNHPLQGKTISGKILVLKSGKGAR